MEDPRDSGASGLLSAEPVIRGIILTAAAVGALCVVAGGAIALYTAWLLFSLIDDPKGVPWLASLIGQGVETLRAARGTLDGRSFDIELGREITNTTLMSVEMPENLAGPADIVVTNPDGLSVERLAAFTYQTVTVSAGASQVARGGVMTVSWIAPAGRPMFDVIALFKEGEVTGSAVWAGSPRGAAAGTLTLAAPSLPGRYQFHYFVDFDHNAPFGPDIYGLPAAHSGVVTVSPAPDSLATARAGCASYLADACVSVSADVAGRWNVTSSDPIRIASPLASGTEPVTGRSPMNVPFLLSRSAMVAPFEVITTPRVVARNR